MKISDILSENKVTVSLEVFPPKLSANFDNVMGAIEKIANLNPAFISCTYGAGGGTSEYTVKISKNINELGQVSMAHLTCVSSSSETIIKQIEDIKAAGIENILALRGDIPEGMAFPGTNQFLHAIELVEMIKKIYPEACIGGACYPEKHPDAVDKNEDIKHIKEKVDAGMSFLTTQMFFDNSIYYNYLYRLREAGITVPVLAGIMPITTRRMLERSVQLSGTVVPARFKAMVDAFGDNNEKMNQVGIIYATEQIVDLIANGCTHIHIYTMNKPEIAAGILNNISALM
ncbi:MAG: methylenetetrahydrofolate reductase [Lachnospiraceae bacterium]|nr:methylenetetrahydrofolate reductase [Lachnospiraceae bacterium]